MNEGYTGALAAAKAELAEIQPAIDRILARPFNQRLDIIAAVIRATKDPSGPLVTRFEKWVLPQLKNMQTKRNDVIHSLWIVQSDGGVTTSQIAARGRLKLKTDKPSVVELEYLADEIVQATNNLHDLIAGLIGVESLST